MNMLDDNGTEVDLSDLVPLHIELTPAEFELVDKLDWWDVEFDDGQTYGPYALYQQGLKVGAFLCECGLEDDTDAEPVAVYSISPVLHRIDYSTKLENPPGPDEEEWAGVPYHA
jgi:hypothetical protein